MTVTKDQAEMSKARVLPWETLGAPTSTPYPYRRVCRGTVSLDEVPGGFDLRDVRAVGADSVYCTRHTHHENELHVCHLRDIAGEPVALIAWGGE